MAVNKRVYTDDDRVSVYTILNANNGNVGRTARDTGVPERTIRNWKGEWDKDGFPEALQEQVQEFNNEFLGKMERTRDKALTLLEQQLHEAKPNQLAVIFGILDDKIRLATGLATARTESQLALPSPETMRELFVGMVSGAIEAQNRREQEIIDAEIVEQVPKALNA